VNLDRAMTQLRIADGAWMDAMEACVQAPPDAGFARRLREVADACEQEQIAFDYAARVGLGWTPVEGSRDPPWELSPGSGRVGPPELWERFDEAYTDWDRSLEAISLPAIARAFGRLGEVARELSEAIEAERGARAGDERGGRSARRSA
jgi:hypothetical protein